MWPFAGVVTWKITVKITIWEKAWCLQDDSYGMKKRGHVWNSRFAIHAKGYGKYVHSEKTKKFRIQVDFEFYGDIAGR